MSSPGCRADFGGAVCCSSSRIQQPGKYIRARCLGLIYVAANVELNLSSSFWFCSTDPRLVASAISSRPAWPQLRLVLPHTRADRPFYFLRSFFLDLIRDAPPFPPRHHPLLFHLRPSANNVAAALVPTQSHPALGVPHRPAAAPVRGPLHARVFGAKDGLVDAFGGREGGRAAGRVVDEGGRKGDDVFGRCGGEGRQLEVSPTLSELSRCRLIE